MRDSTRTRVVSSGWLLASISETFSSRAVVEIVAAPAPVDRAMRITGSSDSVTAVRPSVVLFTTDLDSVGQMLFDLSRASWAMTSTFDAERNVAMSNTIAITFAESIMAWIDQLTGEQGGPVHSTTKSFRASEKSEWCRNEILPPEGQAISSLNSHLASARSYNARRNRRAVSTAYPRKPLKRLRDLLRRPTSLKRGVNEIIHLTVLSS